MKAKKKKKKTKTIGKLIAELQPIFNHFIRLRDKDEDCISCGKYISPQERSNASHLFCVKGWGNLRFNEDNVHKSCVDCNLIKEGNTVEYLKRLPDRIGQQEVSALVEMSMERDKHKWQRFELVEKLAYYKQKVKDLESL